MTIYENILQNIKDSKVVDFIMDNNEINKEFMSFIINDLSIEYEMSNIIQKSEVGSIFKYISSMNDFYIKVNEEINKSNNKKILFIFTDDVYFYSFKDNVEFKDNVIFIFMRHIHTNINIMIYSNMSKHISYLLKNNYITLLNDNIPENNSLNNIIRMKKINTFVK